MRKLIWQPEARRQLESIMLYIGERNYAAAARLDEQIRHHVNLLRQHPFIGRPGRVTGSRELVVHPNYILIYRVREESVEIIRTLHAHQQYP